MLSYCYDFPYNKGIKMKKKKTFIYILAILGFILLDQISKGLLIFLITGRVPAFAPAWDLVPMPILMSQVCDYFNIVFTWNPGTSFSLLRSLGESAPLLIIIATGALIGIIGYYLFAKASASEKWPLVLIFSGAIGNLLDRVRFGAVVDFLDFHIGGYHWPAFNVADICIVLGVALYIINWYVERRRCLKNVKVKGGK